ncbi:hypothetical protein ACEWY4_003826 [Coilia grayii]|uniref:Integrase core domain-containing protein n=1 Tax=Coilia grayii TaxID=363190 RepID=A0ABD1KSE2_9TELE
MAHLHFICSNELTSLRSVSNQVSIPEDVLNAITNLHEVVTQKIEQQNRPYAEVELLDSGVGCPKIKLNEHKLRVLLEMDLSVPSIQTSCCWTRMWESMRRVDGAGVSSRLARSAYGCVVRRVYSVPAPLSLVLLDTNHKLIRQVSLFSYMAVFYKHNLNATQNMLCLICCLNRYGFVIFGAIDGFSRKIMYMGAATDNKASTALEFFLHSVEKHGVPVRVRGDQGCENVDTARWMFTVHGCDRGSFMAGKSVHNQRIERLWRDLWMSVTSIYYNMFHCLEEDGLLDPSDSHHLFAALYVFLPRLQADLESFTQAWDNHSLRTEQNLTPNQLWAMGQIQNPVSPPIIDSQVESK